MIKNNLANKLITSQKGQSYINKDEVIIIYDDTLPKTVMRYTVAHELGHIFLGHNLENHKFLTSPLEKQVFENFKEFIKEYPRQYINTDRDKGIYG